MPSPKKPQDHKPKSAFGKKLVMQVELPSGSVIGLIRPGIQGLVKAEILESFDQLTGIVQTETLPKAEGVPVIDVAAIAKDPKRVEEMLILMDKIVKHVVVEPKLFDPPTLTDEDREAGRTLDDIRDEELAYIDYVDQDDKSFIMQYALGGSADLAKFREATQKALGSVPDGEAAADETV